ncbi:MAG: hypothetical protein WDO56_22470, partial [Gammaproteobacteria bacterium]
MTLIRVLSAVMCLLLVPVVAGAADKPSSAQKRAAGEYLDAVASGSPQAVAFAIHPDELEALRTRVLAQLHEEAGRGDSTIRVRLFGRGKPLSELERMTSIDFYVALGPKLYLFGREYKDADWIAAIPDKNGTVQVLLRGEQEKERGQKRVDVINVVTLRPYGKDWKATLPTEIEAQIDDLVNARRNLYARLPPPASADGPRPGTAGGETGIPPAITTLIDDAGKALAVPNCDDYYNKYMSPNFRKVTAKKAFEALINSCKASLGTRELLVATIRIVKDLVPTFELDGRKAVYDVSGQGLPFDRFVIEQVDRKWYIAE